MRVATDVPSALLSDQPLTSTSPGRRVHGVVIPPLNLRGHSRPTDPWDDGPQDPKNRHPQQPPPPSSSSRRTTSVNGTGAQPATPDRHASGASSGGGGGGNDGRRPSYGAWYMPAKDWKNVYAGGDGGDRRSSSTNVTEGGGGAAAAGSTGSGTGMVPVYVPEGVESGLTKEERASREAMAQELGMSYTARAYKEHLKAHGMRPPGVLERIPTPTEEQTRQHQRDLARAAAAAAAAHPPPPAAAALAPAATPPRRSNGGARSSFSYSTGTGTDAVQAPASAAAATPPQPLSTRVSSPAGAEAATAAAMPHSPFHLQPLVIPPLPALPPAQQVLQAQQSPLPTSLQQLQQQPGLLRDTPRSFAPQPSSRDATSDGGGRQGTAGSSTGAAEMEAEAAPTPPPPPPAAAVGRNADGIETLDEVMAPALRERIRQLLSAQDALIAHQERMRAYEEERQKALRGRLEASKQPAAAAAHRGVDPCLGRTTRASRLADSARKVRSGRNRRRGGRTSRSASPQRSPSPVTRGSVTSLPPTASVATAAAAPKAAGAAAPAAAAAAGLKSGPLPSVVAPRAGGAAAAAKGPAGASAAAAAVTPAAAGAAGRVASRPARPMVLQQSRSLKRVHLVTSKMEKGKEKEKGKANGKGKDMKKEKWEGKGMDKGKGQKGPKSATSSSRTSSSGSSSSSSSSSGSDSSSSSNSSSDDETDSHVSPAAAPPPVLHQAPTAEVAVTAAGPFASAAAVAAAATAVGSTVTTSGAAATACTDAAAVAGSRPHDGSNSEHSLTPQASGASVHAGPGTTRSYGGASCRPNRSSIRASVPPPTKIILPGPTGDLNHLVLLLEKLPSRLRSKPSTAAGAAAGSTSPPRAMLTTGGGGGPAGSGDAAGRSVSPGQDHRRRLVHQLQQQLLQMQRSTSPSGRFAYGVGEPSVWGETVVQAAMSGIPSGAAAAALARCEERTALINRGTISPVPSMLLATAEPSGLVMLAAAAAAAVDRRQTTPAAATAEPLPPPEDSAAATVMAAAAPAPPLQPVPAPAGVDQRAGDSMPLAVQVMLGFVPEYDMLSAPPSWVSYGSKGGSGGSPEAQRSAGGGLGHYHHHHHQHQHRHRRQNSQDMDPRDLHGLHELHGTQQIRHLHPNRRHQHRHRHNHHHHNRPQQLPQRQEGVDAEPSSGWLSDVSPASSPRYGAEGAPVPYGRPYSADAECSGGGGGGDSEGEGLEKAPAGGDRAWRALWERHRLPKETSLPARLTGAATAAREGGGAHSFAPEQVAALVGGRAAGSLSGSGGAGGGGSAIRISGSGAAGPMPPLRVPPPPPLSPPAMVRGGGGALLPGLGAKTAAAAERERGQVGSGCAAGAASAADVGNSPIYELYALGLLPNPSLLRASMAATKPRPNAPARRRHPVAASAAAFGGFGGNTLFAFPETHTAAAAAAASGSFPVGMPHHHARHDLSPLTGPASLALYRRAAAAAAAAGASGSFLVGAGGTAAPATATSSGGGGGAAGGPFSVQPSPMPSVFVHTHPHVLPGSAVQVAEAAEAEEMQARERMGRASALDLQHMMGVDVPAPMLQAR